MFNLKCRIQSIEKSRNTGASTMISSAEVASVKAALRRKLGLPAESEGIPAPISRKALERSTVLQKLRTFLEIRLGVVKPSPTI
jgi:hypothetical protein